MAFRAGLVAEPVERHAEPIVDVALIGEQMSRLAEILRRSEGVLEMSTRIGISVAREALASEREMRADVLAERLAFAAFPRLEFACGKDAQRGRGPAGLVVECAKFHRQIIALPHEIQIPFQLAQTPIRCFAQALPELVTLVEQPCVRRIGADRLVVGHAGFVGLPGYIEVADAEVAPDHRIAGVELRRFSQSWIASPWRFRS